MYMGVGLSTIQINFSIYFFIQSLYMRTLKAYCFPVREIYLIKILFAFVLNKNTHRISFLLLNLAKLLTVYLFKLDTIFNTKIKQTTLQSIEMYSNLI